MTGGMCSLIRLISGLAVFLALPIEAAASDSQLAAGAAKRQSNAALTAHFRGVYRNETLDTQEWRGEETFDLWVHADGSRTLNVLTNLAARSALFDVNLRSDSQFNPLEAFVRYWNQGAYKGSGHFWLEDHQLQITSGGPLGRQTASLAVPASWSIGSHPVSADGWHTARFDPTGEPVQTVSLLSIDASADVSKPVSGRFVPLKIEFIGEETLDVPAGRFMTQHYRLAGLNDLWVAEPHRIVIKSEIPVRNLRYVLTDWVSVESGVIMSDEVESRR
jgi:hypothetical protein